MFSENNFNWQQLQPYIFMIAGLGIMLYAFFKKTKTEALIQTGKKAIGIIFELKGKNSGYTSESFGGVVADKIIVRFKTDELEWITSDAKNQFGMFYTGQYKIGDKVEVMYDTNNPDNFILVTKQSETKARLIIIAAGFIFLLVGIFQLLKSN